MKRFAIALSALGLLLAGTSGLAKKQYYGADLCGYEGFTCIKIKAGDTWRKLFPDRRQREMMKRFNRTNIALRYRSWIVIPKNLKELSHLDLSPFPAQIPANGKRLVIVDLGKQAFGAFNENGELVHWGPVSGGRDYCSDVGRPCRTATGTFTIFRKQGPSCKSSRFPIETAGGAPMPYCMHYYRGFALHGSTLPGFHASHGCIRLFTEDAKWMNHKFTGSRTRIIVKR